jgi:hypothetical protein
MTIEERIGSGGFDAEAVTTSSAGYAFANVTDRPARAARAKMLSLAMSVRSAVGA